MLIAVFSIIFFGCGIIVATFFHSLMENTELKELNKTHNDMINSYENLLMEKEKK